MSDPFDCMTDLVFAETPLAPADVIVIPGSSQAQLMERAAALYHQGYAPYILPSGGPNPYVETTEWAFLRDIGTALGVPEQAILREDQARNTFHNAQYSLEVLRQAAIPHQRILMVCKTTHARRALLTYQTVFPADTTFYVAPTIDRTGISKDNWYLSPKGIQLVLGEMEKIATYFGAHIPVWAGAHNK